MHYPAQNQSLPKEKKRSIVDYYEESQSILGDSLGLSDAASMRRMWRWMAWEGIKDQRNGNISGATEKYSLALTVAQLWMDKTYHHVITQSAISAIILGAPSHAGIHIDEEIEGKEKYFSAFAAYADSVQRPELLRYVEKARKNNRKLQYLNDVHKKTAMKQRVYFAATFFLSNLNIAILSFIIGSVAVGIFLVIAKLFLKNETINIPPRMFWESTFYTATPLLIILIALSLYYANNVFFPSDVIFYPPFSGVPLFFSCLTAVIFGIVFCVKRAGQLRHAKITSKVLLRQRVLQIAAIIAFLLGAIKIVNNFDIFEPLWEWIGTQMVIIIIALITYEWLRKRHRTSSKKSTFLNLVIPALIMGVITSIVVICAISGFYSPGVGWIEWVAIEVVGLSIVSFFYGQYRAWRQKEDIECTFLDILQLVGIVAFLFSWMYINYLGISDMPWIWIVIQMAIIIIALITYEWLHKRHWTSDKKSTFLNLVIPVLITGIIALIIWGCAINLEISNYRFEWIEWAATEVVGLGGVLFFYGQHRAWRQTNDLKETFSGFLQLMRGGVLRWLALGSVLYLLTLCLALPVRAPQNRYVDTYISEGEIAAIEK